MTSNSTIKYFIKQTYFADLRLTHTFPGITGGDLGMNRMDLNSISPSARKWIHDSGSASWLLDSPRKKR